MISSSVLTILFLQCNSFLKSLSLKHKFLSPSLSKIQSFHEVVSFFCYYWFNFFSYFTDNITSNAVILFHFQDIIYGFISRTCCWWLRKVSWSVYKVCTSRGWSLVMLNVAAGEGFSIVSVGSIEEKEFLNEKLDKEKGDGAWSNSWIFNISLFTL